MSNRRSILMFLAGIVLLAAAHFAIDCSRGVGGGTVLRRVLLPASDSVSRIEVARRGSQLTVLVRTNDAWQLTSPFSGSADEQVVKRLLDTLSFVPVVDALTDAELLKMGRERSDFFLGNSVLSIAVKDADGEESVSFGMSTPNADGVYASVSGVDAVFIVPSNVLSAVNLTADSFRRRALFLEEPSTVTAFDVRRSRGGVMSFKREGDGWRTSDGQASSAKVAAFLSDLTAAEAAGFVWPVGAMNETAVASASLLAGYGLDPESSVTVTLKTVDGAGGQASFGKDAGDGLVYALVQNGSAVVTVPAVLKDVIAQETALFADSRLFPIEARSVSTFTVSDGAASYALTRDSAGAWRLDSPISVPADKASVEALLARILALSPSDVDPSGVTVALSAGAKPVAVSRQSVLGDGRLDQLRSREVVKIDPTIVKRLVRTFGGKTIAVVYARDRRVWDIETESLAGSVDEKAVGLVLEALNPLVADRVEKLKVSEADLASYGLDRPFMTLAVDQDREDAVRRNLILGAPVGDGRYATIGASDAVFVLSGEAVSKLTLPLILE